jgi:hypothetical protein
MSPRRVSPRAFNPVSASSVSTRFERRSWMNNQGLPDRMFDGRPVIGIHNTFSQQVVCKLATADRMLGEGKDVGVDEGQPEDVA